MPTGKEKLCFVLMPFKDDLKQVYWQAIKPACETAGFIARRADELVGPFNIHRDIITHIFVSDVIIADLYGWNPNVFYEMGVAHAIDNKTIMIIQEGNELPFDIGNYRCIFYTPSLDGLENLTHRLVKYLETVEIWRQQPTNPVQDFKPYEAFIPTSELKQIQRQLQEKDERLRVSVPKTELEKWRRQVESLNGELAAKEQLLRQSVARSELETLQKELTRKQAENAVLQNELESLRSQLKTPQQAIKPQPHLLRSQPLAALSDEDVKLLKKRYR